jgi:cold shock protein
VPFVRLAAKSEDPFSKGTAEGRIKAATGSCSSECMAKGTVKWFNEKKGFGFIIDPEVASDVFVHFSVIQSDGYKTLNEGETVEYELYKDEKGTKARNVTRILD